MTPRKSLEATLAKAEANLQRAVTALATGEGDRTAASDDLDKARATCRQVQAALTDLDRAEI